MRSETQRFLFALIFAMAAWSARADNMVRAWVDDKGHIHYGNIAPDVASERTLEAPPMPSPEEQEAARERAAKDKERLFQWESSRPADEGSVATEMVACDRAAQVVEFLRQYHELVLMRPLSTGEITWMSPDEREGYLIAAQRFVREQCGSASEVSMHDLWVGLFWPRTARAAKVIPTRFITEPPVVEPGAHIKGARPATSPSNPPSAIVGSKPRRSVVNPGAGSLK